MISSTTYALLRITCFLFLQLILTKLFASLFLNLCFMPVMTRSQTQALTSSTLEPSGQSLCLTNLTTEPSNTTSIDFSSADLIDESLIINPPISPSTGLVIEQVVEVNLSLNTVVSSLPSQNYNAHGTQLQKLLSVLMTDFQTLLDQDYFAILHSSSFGIMKSNILSPTVCHNFSDHPASTMEEDCDNSPNRPNASIHLCTTQDMMDMSSLFTSITSHITPETQKILGDFKQVIKAHDDFKKEVREELDILRLILAEQKQILNIQ
jgi:hypothetical protein